MVIFQLELLINLYLHKQKLLSLFEDTQRNDFLPPLTLFKSPNATHKLVERVKCHRCEGKSEFALFWHENFEVFLQMNYFM
jgi:hypothetical protein